MKMVKQIYKMKKPLYLLRYANYPSICLPSTCCSSPYYFVQMNICLPEHHFTLYLDYQWRNKTVVQTAYCPVSLALVHTFTTKFAASSS